MKRLYELTRSTEYPKDLKWENNNNSTSLIQLCRNKDLKCIIVHESIQCYVCNDSKINSTFTFSSAPDASLYLLSMLKHCISYPWTWGRAISHHKDRWGNYNKNASTLTETMQDGHLCKTDNLHVPTKTWHCISCEEVIPAWCARLTSFTDVVSHPISTKEGPACSQCLKLTCTRSCVHGACNLVVWSLLALTRNCPLTGSQSMSCSTYNILKNVI